MNLGLGRKGETRRTVRTSIASVLEGASGNAVSRIIVRSEAGLSGDTGHRVDGALAAAALVQVHVQVALAVG
jgi:hypothetical protein